MKCDRFFDSYIPRQFIPVYSKTVSRIICGKRKEMNKKLICSLAAAALLAAGCSAPAAASSEASVTSASSEAETATAAEQFTASGAEAMTAAGMSDPIKEIVNAAKKELGEEYGPDHRIRCLCREESMEQRYKNLFTEYERKTINMFCI